MNLPETIQVGPFTVTVTTDETMLLRACKDESAHLLGHYTERKAQIELDADVADDVLVETLLHETLHVISIMAGLNDEFGGDIEEKWVRRMSPLLLDVLRCNPGFVDVLMGVS